MVVYMDNRKAHFNYTVEETFEAGIELLGSEVKSIRAGFGNLAGSFCVARGGEVYLVGMNIPPYQRNNVPKDYDPLRIRRLLLSKKEIIKLSDADGTKGLTIMPLSLYNKNRLIKVSVGIAKGKKAFDKREIIKRRETDREIRREYKVR